MGLDLPVVVRKCFSFIGVVSLSICSIPDPLSAGLMVYLLSCSFFKAILCCGVTLFFGCSVVWSSKAWCVFSM